MKEIYRVYPDEEEEVFLKKGVFGWGVVHPIKDKDGKINWKNFLIGGSYVRLIVIVIFVLLALGTIVEYTDNIRNCNKAIQELNELKNPYQNHETDPAQDFMEGRLWEIKDME